LAGRPGDLHRQRGRRRDGREYERVGRRDWIVDEKLDNISNEYRVWIDMKRFLLIKPSQTADKKLDIYK
jgi:hypothetical protein